MVGALSVDETLWPAANIWVTNMFWDTSAGPCLSSCSALCIGSTRGRIAWVNRVRSNDCFRNERAARERITSVASRTVTDCIMIDCLASGIVTTGSNTGVTALVLDTSFVAWAFGIQDTFRSTIWWGTNVTWKTSTGLITIDFPALGIRATGRGHTWNLGSLWLGDNLWFSVAAVEWITTESFRTGADWVVVDNFAFSIGSTGSWTRINTLLLDTSLGQSTLRAEQTLRPAVGRSTKVSLETGADRSGTLRSALTVGSTRIRVAWIIINRSNRWRLSA